MSTTDKPLVNRIAQSGLITLKLDEHFPQAEMVTFDLKDYLFKELILKEKDFRADLKEHDWTQYQDKVVLIHCSTDAIIPVWAYMLVAAHAAPYAAEVFQGSRDEYLLAHYRSVIEAIDPAEYEDARLVIKGCSDHDVPLAAYVMMTDKLRPVARSIMFGEPCSTVPIYKKSIRRKK